MYNNYVNFKEACYYIVVPRCVEHVSLEAVCQEDKVAWIYLAGVRNWRWRDWVCPVWLDVVDTIAPVDGLDGVGIIRKWKIVKRRVPVETAQTIRVATCCRVAVFISKTFHENVNFLKNKAESIQLTWIWKAGPEWLLKLMLKIEMFASFCFLVKWV